MRCAVFSKLTLFMQILHRIAKYMKTKFDYVHHLNKKNVCNAYSTIKSIYNEYMTSLPKNRETLKRLLYFNIMEWKWYFQDLLFDQMVEFYFQKKKLEFRLFSICKYCVKKAMYDVCTCTSYLFSVFLLPSVIILLVF